MPKVGNINTTRGTNTNPPKSSSKDRFTFSKFPDASFRDQILENMAEGVCLVRWDDATIMYTNPAFDRMLGYERNKLIGKEVSKINSDGKLWKTEITKKMFRTLNHEGKWSGEIINRKKDGSRFVSLVNISQITYPNIGKVWIGVHQDITEYKKAEQEIKRSEMLFKTLTDLAPVGIFETDTEGSCIYVNKKMCDILELKREQVLDHGWEETLHPEDRERVFDRWWEAAKNNREFVNEYRFITPGGKVIWVYGTGTALITDDKVYGYIGTVTDITNQKIASDKLEYYASLSRSISDAVISTDKNFRIKSWNHGAEILYKWKEEEVLGKKIYELLSTHYLYGVKRSDIKEALRQHGTWEGELQHKKKNGEVINILAVFSHINDSEGYLVGIVEVNRDITDRKNSSSKKMNSG